jgi:hypothetical protein
MNQDGPMLNSLRAALIVIGGAAALFGFLMAWIWVALGGVALITTAIVAK